jgi:hypothetical protein
VKFRSVTLYPAGHPPIEIPGPQLLGTKTENGVALVATRDEFGRLVNYVGMPFKMVAEESPSGLVMPHRTV